MSSKKMQQQTTTTTLKKTWVQVSRLCMSAELGACA